MNNKIFIFLTFVLLLIAGLSGCIEEKTNTFTFIANDDSDKGEVVYTGLTLDDLNFSISNYPTVDSSTSAFPLNYIIACNILNASYYWVYDLYGYVMDLYVTADDSNISDFINHINISGTHDAYMNLIDGNADIVLVARPPSEDELSHANNNSVNLVTKAVALDAFVFITNVANPVESLTVKQIQDIYTGSITNWSQLGGNSLDIIAYQRNKNSGSQELMESLVMKDLEIAELPELTLFGMGGPFDRLVYDFQGEGLAYTVYYYKEFLTNTSDSIKMLGVNGVVPSYENISNSSYEYVTEVYAVIRSDLDGDSNSYKLRDWLLGESGQEIVRESGYVSIS